MNMALSMIIGILGRVLGDTCLAPVFPEAAAVRSCH